MLQYQILKIFYIWRCFSKFVLEKLSMSRDDVTVVYHDDVILIGWSIPPVYHTLAIIEQCFDDVTTDTPCIEHDVTSSQSGGLTVSRLNGTSLSLVVYQDRDEVVRLPLTQKDSDVKDDDTGWSKQSRILLIPVEEFHLVEAYAKAMSAAPLPEFDNNDVICCFRAKCAHITYH